jgi:hypothetical protein
VLQLTELPGHDPPIQVPAGEWLCRGTYYNKVGRAKQWYTLSEIPVTVRLQQVYCANIPVEAENNINKLPSTCRQAEARKLGAVKVSDAEHARIICVKARRDEMDVVEEIMDDVEEASDEEDVMEEDEDEDEDGDEDDH